MTAFVQRHRMLLDHSTQAALGSIDNRLRCLPSTVLGGQGDSADLATAAVLCAGLEAGAELYGVLGDVRRPTTSGAHRGETRSRQTSEEMAIRGTSEGAATASTWSRFLLPPVGSTVDPGVLRPRRRHC